MTSCRSGRIRRFRFNLPQRIAAALLALFLVQGLWLIGRQAQAALTLQSFEHHSGDWPAIYAGSLADCPQVPDGILVCYMVRIPVAFQRLAEQRPSLSVAPQDEARDPHPFTTQILMRLPFLAAGVLLGGALWWVTRRLYGNRGGYTALAFYCFSPAVLQASTVPNAAIPAALGVYGGIYTCIGVAHAMQGPKRKWRPRIVLLTAIFACTAASHLPALAVAAALGVALMLWVAEQNRRLVIPVILIATAVSLAAVFVGSGFSVTAFASLLGPGAGGINLSLRPATGLFGSIFNAGITTGAVIALALFLSARKFRYFGNTAPLLCVLLLLALPADSASPWLWALPFLLTFVAGVFADAYESSQGLLVTAVACLLVLLQAVASILSIQKTL